MTSKPVEAVSVRAVIERYLAAYNASDYATCETMFADDALFEDPVGGRRFEGIEQIRGFLRSAPPEIKISSSLYKIVECGRDALFHYAMTITGWKDVPIDIEVFETIEIDAAGQIRQLRAYWNEASIKPVAG